MAKKGKKKVVAKRKATKPRTKKRRAGAPIKATSKKKPTAAAKKRKADKRIKQRKLNKGSGGYYKVYNILKKYTEGKYKADDMHTAAKKIYSFLREKYSDEDTGKFKLTTDIIESELGSKKKTVKLMKAAKLKPDYDSFSYDYFELDDELAIRVYKPRFQVILNMSAIDEGVTDTIYGNLDPVEIISIINAWRDANGGKDAYPSGAIMFSERGYVMNEFVSLVLEVKDMASPEHQEPDGEEVDLTKIHPGPEVEEEDEEEVEPEAEVEKEKPPKEKEPTKEEKEVTSSINKERIRKEKAEADTAEISKLNTLIKALYEEAKMKKDLGMDLTKTLKKIEDLEDRRDKFI